MADKKTKNVAEFSPVATRVYDAVKKSVIARNNPTHAKRVIDTEFAKFKLKKAEIQEDIAKAVAKAEAKMLKDVEVQIEQFTKDLTASSEEKVLLQNTIDAKIEAIEAAGKELEGKNQEIEELKGANESLVTEVEELKAKIPSAEVTGEK